MSDKNETRAARAADELADVANLAAMQALTLHGMRSLATAVEPIDDADALRGARALPSTWRRGSGTASTASRRASARPGTRLPATKATRLPPMPRPTA